MKYFQIRFKKPIQIAKEGEFANGIICFHRVPHLFKEDKYQLPKGLIEVKVSTRFRYAIDIDLYFLSFRFSFLGLFWAKNPNSRFLWRK